MEIGEPLGIGLSKSFSYSWWNEYEDKKNAEANEHGDIDVETKKPRKSKSPEMHSKFCVPKIVRCCRTQLTTIFRVFSWPKVAQTHLSVALVNQKRTIFIPTHLGVKWLSCP